VSNYLAVATVTAALSQIIRSAITRDVNGALVTVARPHSSGGGTTPEDPTVNLYLYQVTPNKALRNNDLPTRSSDGGLKQRSQLALDLHYLVTFYGDESELIPQRLLGSVMRTLNSRPILTRDIIDTTINGGSFPYLDTSDLAEAVETVKFSQIPFSLEELSKLWSVFLQTPYTLSVAFQGTVVIIDGLESPSTSLPVRSSNIYVNPFRQPVIESIESSAGAAAPIDATTTVLIKGRELRGDITEVKFGAVNITPAQVSNTLIPVDLATVPAANMRAGVQAVQIIQPLLIGSPATPHPGIESGAAAVTVVPVVNNIQVNNLNGAGADPRSADLVIQVNPNIGKSQRIVLMLNERVSNDPMAYTFVGSPVPAGVNPPPESVSSVTIPVSGVKAGTYLARLMVDGATSQLTVDGVTGEFNGPVVTIA